jgi:hypothetical protein
LYIGVVKTIVGCKILANTAYQHKPMKNIKEEFGALIESLKDSKRQLAKINGENSG